MANNSTPRFEFLLFLFLYLLIHVSADQVITSYSGAGSFGASSREPKYDIKFHPEHLPFHSDDDLESVFMPNENGKNFLCFLPKVEKPKSGMLTPQQNTSSMIMESEKPLRVKTPDELLELLKEQPCLVRQEGWWTYEFCYHKILCQLHVEDGKRVQEFVLGLFDPEETEAYNQNLSDISRLKDPRSKDASLRYHAHQYTNGTTCDLTGRPRETEVRFVCSEEKTMISSITELSTCKYALTVYNPLLCRHPMFQEEKPVQHTIHCNALPKDVKEDAKEEKSQDEPQIELVTEKSQDEPQIKLVTELDYPLHFEAEEFAA